MPFRSESQRRYLWANHPEIARRWTEEHGSKPVAASKDPSFSSRSEYQKRHPPAQKKMQQAIERRLIKRQGLDRSSTGRIAKGTPAGTKYNRDTDERLQRAVKRRLGGS